jgi:hypothetical protein
LEDQYLHDRIKNRREYLLFLDHPPYENRPDIKKEILYKWYMETKKLIIKKPNNESRAIFLKSISLTDSYIDIINNLVDKLQNDKKILGLIDELYDNFGTLINNDCITC